MGPHGYRPIFHEGTVRRCLAGLTTRSLLDASDGRPGQRFSGLISYPPEFSREPNCFAVRVRHLERWLGVLTPTVLSLLHMGTRYYHFGEVVRTSTT
jgi:hypothetical protein